MGFYVAMDGTHEFECPACGVRFVAGARVPVERLDLSTDPAGVICRVCAGEVSERDAADAPALRGADPRA